MMPMGFGPSPDSEPSVISPPVGVTPDGVITYGALNEEYRERIPGVNPETGEPDSRYDGWITSAVLVTRSDSIHPAPDPHSPQLVEAVRSSDLMIASDLGVGLAQLAEDHRLRSQADDIRRGLEERYRP